MNDYLTGSNTNLSNAFHNLLDKLGRATIKGDNLQLTIRPKVGYTGDPPQTRADMLKNSHFQDIRVHVYAKHSSSQWIEIGAFDLPRQLLTPQR